MASQADVYQFVVDFKEKHDGLSPSMREIMSGCGMHSVSHVAYYLRRLEELDLIQVNGRRGIQVVGGAWVAPDHGDPEMVF